MSESNLIFSTLRITVISGIVILAIGLLLSEQAYGEKIMWAGVLVLICSPLLGVLVTYVVLIKERDWFWVKVASVLIAVLSMGIILSLLKV